MANDKLTDPAWIGLEERYVEAFVDALERPRAAGPTDFPPSGAKGWGPAASPVTANASAHVPPSSVKGWG